MPSTSSCKDDIWTRAMYELILVVQLYNDLPSGTLGRVVCTDASVGRSVGNELGAYSMAKAQR